METNGSKEDVLSGLQDDAAKLRRLTTGNKELDAVAQILGRVAAVLSDVNRRLQAIEAALPHAQSHRRHPENTGPRQPEDAGMAV